MKDIETKREREKRMVSQMIALYCHRNHHTKGVLCPECAALREKIRAVMRFFRPADDFLSPLSPQSATWWRQSAKKKETERENR